MGPLLLLTAAVSAVLICSPGCSTLEFGIGRDSSHSLGGDEVSQTRTSKRQFYSTSHLGSGAPFYSEVSLSPIEGRQVKEESSYEYASESSHGSSHDSNEGHEEGQQKQASSYEGSINSSQGKGTKKQEGSSDSQVHDYHDSHSSKLSGEQQNANRFGATANQENHGRQQSSTETQYSNKKEDQKSGQNGRAGIELGGHGSNNQNKGGHHGRTHDSNKHGDEHDQHSNHDNKHKGQEGAASGHSQNNEQSSNAKLGHHSSDKGHSHGHEKSEVQVPQPIPVGRGKDSPLKDDFHHRGQAFYPSGHHSGISNSGQKARLGHGGHSQDHLKKDEGRRDETRTSSSSSEQSRVKGGGENGAHRQSGAENYSSESSFQTTHKSDSRFPQGQTESYKHYDAEEDESSSTEKKFGLQRRGQGGFSTEYEHKSHETDEGSSGPSGAGYSVGLKKQDRSRFESQHSIESDIDRDSVIRSHGGHSSGGSLPVSEAGHQADKRFVEDLLRQLQSGSHGGASSGGQESSPGIKFHKQRQSEGSIDGVIPLPNVDLLHLLSPKGSPLDALNKFGSQSQASEGGHKQGGQSLPLGGLEALGTLFQGQSPQDFLKSFSDALQAGGGLGQRTLPLPLAGLGSIEDIKNKFVSFLRGLSIPVQSGRGGLGSSGLPFPLDGLGLGRSEDHKSKFKPSLGYQQHQGSGGHSNSRFSADGSAQNEREASYSFDRRNSGGYNLRNEEGPIGSGSSSYLPDSTGDSSFRSGFSAGL